MSPMRAVETAVPYRFLGFGFFGGRVPTYSRARRTHGAACAGSDAHAAGIVT